jgi:polyhydroxyalkanoate synthesis repressor PhaR
MKPSSVVIRKYPNRRLYDTSAGRYVNLEDVAAMIRQGIDVQVTDAKTGEDLTRVVLTQIITEDAKGQPTGLPLELLRQLIMSTDRAGKEFIMWYLKSAFDAYQKVQDSVQTRLSDVRSAAMSPFSMVKNLLTPESPAADTELEQLRRRVAELEARAKPERKKRPRRPAAGARRKTPSDEL